MSDTVNGMSGLITRVRDAREPASILGTSFDTGRLAQYAACAETIHLVLALPEIGAFAQAELSEKSAFRALSCCIVGKEETIIVSKTSFLTTPVIRCRTEVPASTYGGA